jgi:glycosyltransferase involved in cell wall biosynthesis
LTALYCRILDIKLHPDFGMPEEIKPDILHLEACNFIDKPMGGQLNFSRQLIKALGNRLALVGWASAPSEPVGCWFNKTIDGITYRYFAFGRDVPSDVKPLIPARITTWLQIKHYQNRIFSIGIKNIIVQEHSILMAMKSVNGYNLCYCFPGVNSPLSISRYPWAIRFAALFDHIFFRALGRKANCILAAADEAAIADFKHRAGRRLKGKDIVSFPTRVDTDIFHPADRLLSRKKLGLPGDAIIAVTTGRIHWAKGWPFLLESFKLFLARFPNSLLIFIGDGDEKEALEIKALDLGLKESVIIAGYQSSPVIATYLQASDMFVMGSLKEGWSTVLVEALACHLPIVTTRFSSADTVVQQGVNGFVVERAADKFAKAMEAAINLSRLAMYAESVIDRYALKNLASDLFKIWPLIKKSSNMQKVTL